jgi:putative oxidoreductase
MNHASEDLYHRLARWINLLNRIPYALIALVARAATFSVFFRSGTQKLSDWNATLMLFQNEYRVPLLPPHLAAYMAASLELGASVLILVGLATRISVLALLGLATVIQTFVYPSAWPDHIQWLAFMLILLARGPGAISLDALVARRLRLESQGARPSSKNADNTRRTAS